MRAAGRERNTPNREGPSRPSLTPETTRQGAERGSVSPRTDAHTGEMCRGPARHARRRGGSETGRGGTDQSGNGESHTRKSARVGSQTRTGRHRPSAGGGRTGVGMGVSVRGRRGAADGEMRPGTAGRDDPKSGKKASGGAQVSADAAAPPKAGGATGAKPAPAATERRGPPGRPRRSALRTSGRHPLFGFACEEALYAL